LAFALLTANHLERYGRFDADPMPEQLGRCFTLEPPVVIIWLQQLILQVAPANEAHLADVAALYALAQLAHHRVTVVREMHAVAQPSALCSLELQRGFLWGWGTAERSLS